MRARNCEWHGMCFCVRVTRSTSTANHCECGLCFACICGVADALCCESECDWLRTAVGAVGMGKRGWGGPANGSWVHGSKFVQWGSAKGRPPNCIRRGGGKAVGCKLLSALCSYSPALATRWPVISPIVGPRWRRWRRRAGNWKPAAPCDREVPRKVF